MKKSVMSMLNLPKNKKYLLACSFGPDSMCLFDALLKENYDFLVAHVNYHLRKESDDEEKALRSFCTERNIPLFVYDNQESIKNNTEERCREIRYKFFEKVYGENNIDALLIAHNQDDHIETYLLQKKRKNIVKQYGLKECSTYGEMTIYRPLLNMTKKDVMSYNLEQKVRYAIDQTNLLDIYERNKIRHHIIERLSAEERNNILLEIDNENKNLMLEQNCVQEFNKKYIDIDDLANYSILQINMILFRLCKDIDYQYELTHKQVKEIIKLMYSSKPNVISKMNKNLVFIKEYDKGYFSNVKKTISYEFIIEKPCVIDNEYFYFNGISDTSNRHIFNDSYPLTIRTYRQGDEYQINDYKVKVNKLFKDMKLPLKLRERWPLILNKDNVIIYIPRYQKDFIVNKDLNFYVK